MQRKLSQVLLSGISLVVFFSLGAGALATTSETSGSVGLFSDQSLLTPQLGSDNQGKKRVIVSLKLRSFRPEGKLNGSEIKRQRRKIRGLQRSVLSSLGQGETAGIKRFKYVAGFAAVVSKRAHAELRKHPLVESVRRDKLNFPSLQDSVPLIGVDKGWDAGYSGEGQTVAILDTGIDNYHPFLAGKVVSEACYSTAASLFILNVCPGGQSGAYSGAGVPCSVFSGCYHGTHVAGIATGNGVNSGVAKEANLVSVQVFSGIVDPVFGSLKLGAFDSDIILGLQHVQSTVQSGTADVAAVNMSLGSGTYSDSATCDSQGALIKSEVDNLRSLGTPTVVASGNAYDSTGISFPACISTAVSVGSTTKSDAVSGFSNSASILDLLAPGGCGSILSCPDAENITSSIPGGGFDAIGGTSMAAPHVAGTWAVLKSLDSSLDVSTTLTALSSTGVPILDPKNGLTKPRIQVDAALKEFDKDLDGVPDGRDNCLDTKNPGQEDKDGDGIGNACDTCPSKSNPRQKDTDDDGTGDVCDDFNNIIDLQTDADVQIDGAAIDANAGRSVAGVGDVNGDGFEDVLIGAPRASGSGKAYTGSAYVVFGKSASVTINLASLGSQGFRIDGAAVTDNAGWTVSGAGDVNDDGLADVILSEVNDCAPWPGCQPGSAYVVFGKSSDTTVDLSSLGSQGFRIDGIDAYMKWVFFSVNNASRVAGVGDINDDGLDDVIVGAHGVATNSAYVVFGKASDTTVDVNSLGSQGFRIHGDSSHPIAGWSVAGAGDVNDDAIPDVIVGAIGLPPGSTKGSAYVVFGKSSNTTVDLASLGVLGFRIDGVAEGDYVGDAIGGVGDINDDGFDDVIVGADTASCFLGPFFSSCPPGAAYVVFGKSTTSTIDLSSLGSQGFRIDGADENDRTGFSVAGAGDVNDDGIPDIIVGADEADSNGKAYSGSTYVVFGKLQNTTIDLGSLGSQGFRIDGAAASDYLGYSVASAGDFNGDGRPDVLVGAPYADKNGKANSGSAYIVFGPNAPCKTEPKFKACWDSK